MKDIYLYFVHGKEILDDLYPAIYKNDIEIVGGVPYAFYAFTPDKNVRSNFLRERNMNIFIEKVCSMSKEDYDSFCDENEDKLLEFHNFATQYVDDFDIIQQRYLYLLTTRNESDSILYFGEEKICDIFSYLNDEILNKFIKKLNPKMKTILDNDFHFEEMSASVGPLEEGSGYSMAIDEVALYVHMFGNTYKERIR